MRIPVIVLLLLSCLCSFSQSFDEALRQLNQNNLAEAKKSFTKLRTDNKVSSQSLLALSLIEINNGHYEEAFDYFQTFFSNDSNPYPYVYAVWTSGIFTSSSESGSNNVKSFMTRLASDPKADVTLRAMAADNVAGRLQRGNKISDSKSWYAKIDDIKNWSTVGTFQNVSASGFNKDFGPLAHPEATYSFTNNIGAPVMWFAIPDARNDRWWDFTYHYDINNSIIYAQTFLQADANVDARLLLGVSGSFKIWVNDFLVAGEAEERNTDIDVYQYGVKLQKGYNRILLQLGSSELSASNYMLRITDMNGNLLTNYNTTDVAQPYAVATPYDVKRFSFAPEKYFEDKIVSAPSFIDKMMLVNIYNHNDKRYEARKLAQQLKKEDPQSTLVSQVLIETYSRDNNNTDLTKELEFIKTNDSLSLYGLTLLYNEAKDREDYNEAGRLLEKRVSLYGSNADTEVKLLDILSKKKDYEGLIKELDIAFKKYPNEYAFVYMQYNVTDNITKDLKKSNDILVKYLKENYNEEIIEVVAANKMQLGKKEEAFKQLNNLIEDMPYATMRYARIGDKYFDTKDYNNALVWQQQAIDRAPYAGYLHYTKGVIYEAARRKPEALNAYKKAIVYGPSNYDARRKLRELEGKKDLFKSFKENDVYAMYKTSPAASAYPNDNSIYLLKDLQQIVYPENGASEERNDLLVKIFNPAGIDDWKEVSIPYNSYTQRLLVDKAEILKKDGSKVPAETNDNEIVFSSLEIGDAIHILYKLETSTSGKLAEHFWEDFNFNNGYPVKVARYSLMVPGNKPFKYQLYNSDLKPTITDVDSYKLYVWEKSNSEAVQSEPYMPAFADISERVVVTSIPDWNYVANWYSDLSNVKAKSDFEIKETVKELMAGKQALNDIQKARLIYNYIEENFNYSDVPFLHSALTPQRASRTLRTRLGDCKDLSTLFVAMGKEAGLNTNLVLVDTRNNGDKNLDLPTIGFNHCIAQLKTGDNNYLVELTDNHLPFGAMGYNLLNANGLYIPKDGASTTAASLSKLNSNNRPQNFIDRVTTLKFNGSTAEIERKNKRFGAEAAGIRSGYKDKGDEDRKKDLLSSLSSEFNKKVSLKSLTIEGLDNLADTLQMNYSFTIDKFTSELMGMQIFKLPWSDSYNSLEFVSLEKRKYPLNIWSFSSTSKDKESITIQLPAGKKLAEIPKNIVLTHPAISYSLSYTIKPSGITVLREVKYLKEQVTPDEYESFKEVITKMNEADAKQYGIK
jgi:tetratricopeptide (TPR) repeat protein